MKTILIVLIFSTGSPGMSITTHEFNNFMACKMVAQKMLKGLEIRGSIRKYAQCIKYNDMGGTMT